MSQRKGAYAPEFRQQMVGLVRAGRKPSELAKEFGCHDTSIGAWVRQANADDQGGGRIMTERIRKIHVMSDLGINSRCDGGYADYP